MRLLLLIALTWVTGSFAAAPKPAELLQSMAEIPVGAKLTLLRDLRVPAGSDVIFFDQGRVKVRALLGAMPAAYRQAGICWMNIDRSEEDRVFAKGSSWEVGNVGTASEEHVVFLSLTDRSGLVCKRPLADGEYPLIGTMLTHLAPIVWYEAPY